MDDWEREIADDEVMRDASPPPRLHNNLWSRTTRRTAPGAVAPGQVEALETVGICMLVEYMLAPPARRSPNN